MTSRISGGCILLARKLLESGIMQKPPLYLKIWIWLLLRATKKPYKDLQPGQLRASIPEIQEAMSYRVGYRKEMPTKRVVQQALEWLRNPVQPEPSGGDLTKTYEIRTNGTTKVTANGPMIVTTKGPRSMLITICNYEYYQDMRNYEGVSERTNEGVDEKTTNGTTMFHEEQVYIQEEQVRKKKKTSKVFDVDSREYKLAEFFVGLLDARGYEWPKGKKPDLQTWAAGFDAIMRIDGRGYDRIREVLDWCQRDSFWMSNILSPGKLRDQWGKLADQMRHRQSKPAFLSERERKEQELINELPLLKGGRR